MVLMIETVISSNLIVSDSSSVADATLLLDWNNMLFHSTTRVGRTAAGPPFKASAFGLISEIYRL